MVVARLSLSHFRDGSKSQRDDFIKGLMDSFTTCGFIKLDDHGMDERDVAEMLQWSHRFFELPLAARESCAHVPGPDPQRGYSRIGDENLARFYSNLKGETPPEARRDHKELYDVGPPDDEHFPNRWPDEQAIPGFRSFIETTYAKFQSIVADILEALELGMGVQSGSLTSKCKKHASEFRFVHYPSIDARILQDGMVSRVWPHYDIGVLSLLFQDDVGGLQMAAGDGSDDFVSVTSDKPTDLIVNVAETLERWSNGILRAGLHRVTFPPDTPSSGLLPERFSAVYFCKADRTSSVAPLPDLISAKNPAQYDDITALQYHQKRVLSAYT